MLETLVTLHSQNFAHGLLCPKLTTNCCYHVAIYEKSETHNKLFLVFRLYIDGYN